MRIVLGIGGGIAAYKSAVLLRLLTDDAARLTQGEPALADTDPELAQQPSRLTVTLGFGPRVIDRFGRLAVLRTACALALVGLGVFVFSPSLAAGMIALFLWGIGASLGFPLALSAAGDSGPNPAARVALARALVAPTAALAAPAAAGCR